ncbi:MAG: hypothetical protein K2I52_03640, partial [Muribaculaceae bacterium]|nr:hypothetical protein [Muribaculaceae bacterium]
MKKTFLKATLFSLMLGALPTTMLTGCKDYDDDIDRLTQRDETLQKEINDKLAQQNEALKNQIEALQKALDEQKAEAARANDAAQKAAEAAAAAQQTGDKALEAAQTANAEALAAQAAAAQAKVDAIAEATKQVSDLRDAINTQIADLEKKYSDQYTQISSALANAATKQDLNDAVKALEASIEASKLTKADVEAMLAEYISQINENTTKIAAMSGVIDGISADVNTLKTDLGNIKNDIADNKTNIAANAANIAAEANRINEIVNTTIPGIENSITALDTKLASHLSAYNTFSTQVNTQLAALEEFKTLYEGLFDGLNSDVTAIKTRLSEAETKLIQIRQDIDKNTADIATINGLITDLQTKGAANDQAISELQSDLGNIQQEIAKINSALSTLQGINAKRLTSLTLIPKAYVGGIPTIEFYSASFNPMGALDTETGFYAAPATDAKPVIVTNNDTKVLYRMNPAGVSLSDIVAADVTFVQQTATSRAAEKPVVKVVSVDTNEDNQLVVTATKAEGVTNSIDNAGAGKIYTVALRVPIAPENYYTLPDGNKESAEDAVVYSEYCRLAESTFVPEIAWDKEYAEGDEIAHFWDQTLWDDADAEIVSKVPYSMEDGKTFDLHTLVAGCMNDEGEHILMSDEQLASFGFTFVFSVAKKPYEVDGVNQQEYANVTAEGALTPVQPEGETASSRVGKTPIISVVMMNGEQVVGQRFFKIKYVISAEATDYAIELPAKELSCNDYVETVTWKMFNDEIISKLPFEMNQTEFISTYTDWEVSNQDCIYVDMSTDADQPLRLRSPLKDNMNMNGQDKDFEQTVTFKSSVNGFPEIKVTLKSSLLWPKNLPTLGATDHAYWTNGVMQILPQAMPNNYNGETATYNTNVLSGRHAPYLNNLLECANWDVQIMSVPAPFAVGAKAPVTEGNDGYNVVKGEGENAEVAASLWYGDDEHTPFSLDGEDVAAGTTLKVMNFFIENNPSGIELVENETTIDLGWYIFLNGAEYQNNYTLGDTKLQIIKPLQKVNAGTIEPLKQSAEEQIRDLAEGLTITDCFGKIFTDQS